VWVEGRGHQRPPAVGRGGDAVARTRESGEAQAMRGYATDMRGRVVSGPGGSGRGTREREERGSAAMGR
jgi:hypothetical protein